MVNVFFTLCVFTVYLPPTNSRTKDFVNNLYIDIGVEFNSVGISNLGIITVHHLRRSFGIRQHDCLNDVLGV